MLLHVAALVATLAALLAAPMPTLAASSVQLDARALAGARFEVGGWIGISATLVNTGEPTDGYLTATTDAGTVRRAVELPAGARKTVTLYVQPDPFQRAIDIRYEEPNGTVTARVEVRVFESTVRQLAIVGDGAGTLRPQFAGGRSTAASRSRSPSVRPTSPSGSSRSPASTPWCGRATAPR